MARDEHLLYSDTLWPASLRIYAWSAATISLGYFQRFEELGRLPEELRGLPVVRRQTGGGAILHDCEITYCLVVDDSLMVARDAPVGLYRLVHTCWRDAIAAEHPEVQVAPGSYPIPSPRTGPFFCFQEPGHTDLIVGDEKLLGSAQRRVAGRVLQHGSLLLGRRFASHPGAHLGDPPTEAVQRWTAAFIATLATALELEPRSASWSNQQLADVARRRAKYAGHEWTRLR